MESTISQSDHRVALITGGLALGGSTTFLINFAGELVRRGVPVEVLSFEKENPMASDFERLRVPVLCLDDRHMIYEDRLKIILQNLARFQPTVVVSTLGPTSFEVLRYLPRGIFRIGMAQSHEPGIYKMMQGYAPWMDLAAMVSQTMKQTADGIPEFARVAYLPYGVPINLDPEQPARDFTKPLRVLYLGRLYQEQKRVRLFPEILRPICDSGMPFHWTIAGAGPELNFLKANLKTNSPNQTISFPGPVNYADVPALLKQHDIFLLASDYEGLPLSLLEAMAQGMVPVVSDLESGLREVVDKSSGLLVPINDTPGYARGIIHLHEYREELAAKSAAARSRVQQDFSVAAMTNRWLAVFPREKTTIEPWPKRWRIQAVLTAGNPFRFSPPMRILRRLAARMRR
ncbi:MAG TPA: glycosyltransferase family 4 protein [Verrucomicrobiae bacterium]|jgi:glycosyltransferase involved in cell wall biosynthesis|nr:glycosyltransferase family 4 protein [Verrucomicrobiae bacterium]